MNKYILLFSVFVILETILSLIFTITAQLYYEKRGFDFKSVIKGIVERGFLLVMLLGGYPHALTLFGALKLATRLKHNETKSDEENKFNDYYLIGNLVSVCFAAWYVYLWNNVDSISIFKRLIQN